MDESHGVFLTRRPKPPLDRYVQMIWLWRGPPPPHQKDRMLPTGTASLVINLAADELRMYDAESHALTHRIEGAGFTGAQLRPFVIDTAEQVFVAGVEFRLGGAWPFMNSAQDELTDCHVTLRDLWGQGVATLRERLLLTGSDRGRLDLLEDTLRARVCRPLEGRAEVLAAMQAIERRPTTVRIAELDGLSSLSRRRLTRLFALQVGMLPKTYARLLRFRRVLAEVHAHPVVSWADVAVDCGYFDQAHLTRDFKHFSGFTPAQYRSTADAFSNHVPIA